MSADKIDSQEILWELRNIPVRYFGSVDSFIGDLTANLRLLPLSMMISDSVYQAGL